MSTFIDSYVSESDGTLSSSLQSWSRDTEATFKKEDLIPLIMISRKLLSCDLKHQSDVLLQLNRVLRSHETSISLMQIIVTGLFQRSVFEKIPAELYQEIRSILPLDKQLDLKDSVYESRLVETPEDTNSEQESKDEEKEELPLTLVRIPTDLQNHLFHYLDFKDLVKVQGTCRALCIAARNPSALHKLLISFGSTHGHYHQFVDECYSQPKLLRIQGYVHPFVHNGYQSMPRLIGNPKWADHVVDLFVNQASSDSRNVHLDFKPFMKLKKCEIWCQSNLLLNGAISCYDTLKELCLGGVRLTEDVIAQIQKFQNLERLSLKNILEHGSSSKQSRPIILPSLKTFSLEIEHYGFREFQRILVGSHPQEINIASIWKANYNDSVSETPLIPIPTIPLVQHLNIKDDGLGFFIEKLSGWLKRAQCVGPVGRKLFAETNLVVDFNEQQLSMGSVSDLCQCSNKTTLEFKHFATDLKYSSANDFVDRIRNASFGTFTEIKVNIGCAPLRYSEYNCGYYVMRMASSLKGWGHSQDDHRVVRRVFTEAIDDAEQLIKQWMVFDQVKMKKIGLEKLDINVECNMKWEALDQMASTWTQQLKLEEERYQQVLNQKCGQWVLERINHWNKLGRKGISAQTCVEEDGYIVSFSLGV